MTDTLISLISILTGIIAANLFGFRFKKYTQGLIGNTIAGTFGSILLIKSLGRLGFDPTSIMQSGTVDLSLFAINSILSFCGGILALLFIKKLRTRINKASKKEKLYL